MRIAVAPVEGARWNVGVPAAAAPAPPVPAAAPIGERHQWTEVGRVRDPRLTEISGVASSPTHEGVMWVHNDSGDSPRIFALAADGAVRGEVRVRGAEARDWEDIAMGPGPRGATAGTPWVYVADVGDNAERRSSVQVYRFPEPAAADGAVDAHKVELTFGDRRSHNVEAMLVDPRTGDLVLVTKVKRGPAQVFRATAEQLDTGKATLELLGTVPGTGPLVTGGDVALDGSRVVLRSYESMYAWQVREGETMAQALLRQPLVHDLPKQQQGESITFTPDATGWLSISEGRGEPIWRDSVPPLAALDAEGAQGW